METIRGETVNEDKILFPVQVLSEDSNLGNVREELKMLNNKIFIVHGRNEELRDKVELLV